MACNILKERPGMWAPIYFLGEGALCSDGGMGDDDDIGIWWWGPEEGVGEQLDIWMGMLCIMGPVLEEVIWTLPEEKGRVKVCRICRMEEKERCLRQLTRSCAGRRRSSFGWWKSCLQRFKGSGWYITATKTGFGTALVVGWEGIR